jgi:hypothetical protein
VDYRDERDALRNKVSGLEQELEERKRRDDRADRSEAALREIEAMRARLDALAEQLGVARAPRARPSGAARVALAALVLAGGGAACWLLMRQPKPPARDEVSVLVPPPPRPVQTPHVVADRRDAYWVSSLCMMSDGHIAGMGRVMAEGFRAMLFDGKTGKVRWASSRTFNTGGRRVLWCGPKTVVVLGVEKDAHVYAFDADTGEERWVLETADTPTGLEFGADCARVSLVDASTATVSLATGKPAPCKSAPNTRSPESPREIPRDRAPATLTDAEGTLTLTPKPAGTPEWSLKGGEPPWVTRIDLAALDTFTAFPLLAEGPTAFVLGNEPHGDAVGFAAVSRKDGKVFYRTLIGKTGNSWIPYFAVRAGLVYVAFGGALRAYDAETGAERWRTHD